MPAKWHKYSYTAQIQERRTLTGFLSLLVLMAVLVALIYGNLIAMYEVESPTMQPTLADGEYVITTPLYSASSKSDHGFSLLMKPVHGDLAVIDPAYTNDLNIFLKAANSFVSFITFRKIRPFSSALTGGEQPVIRRIMAFPGDSLYMENFIIHVKTADSGHYLTEYEINHADYDLQLDELPAQWSPGMPFSGNFEPITLGPNDYFVMADNRITSCDSRTWGTIPAERIKAKVLLRYWPFSRFGKP